MPSKHMLPKGQRRRSVKAEYRATRGVNPGANVNDPTDDRPLRMPDIQQLHLQFRAHLKPLLKVNLEAYLETKTVWAKL